MDWSKNIKKLRNKMLVTQTELANIIGISFASINRYENNIFEPTMKIKRKLVELFIEYNVIKGNK